MKTLVLFTMQFPYGKGEAFIESELPFLCAAFEKVIIVTNDISTPHVRAVPGNIEVIRQPFSPSTAYKVKAALAFFSSRVLNEIKFIHQTPGLKLTKRNLFTLLASVAKGYETRDLILDTILKPRGLNLSNTWLYSYWLYDPAVGLAMIKEQHPNAKVFCRAHRWDLYFYTNTDNYLPLRPYLLQHLDKCFSISDDGQQYLQQLLGKETVASVAIARLGVSNKYAPLPYKPAGIFTIVSCSTLTAPKRVALIAKALAAIPGLHIKWLHFGDGILRDEVEKTAVDLLSPLNIEYKFMGNYSNADLLKFYAEHGIDLFINVSSSEGIPVSIMEAMSFGIPVLATAIGGTPEIVKNEYNGYLLQVNDTPAQIAAVIKSVIELSDEKKTELRKNAFVTWSEKYNADKNYAAFTAAILAL